MRSFPQGLQGELERLAAWTLSLAPEQQSLLFEYSRNWYRPINSALRARAAGSDPLEAARQSRVPSFLLSKGPEFYLQQTFRLEQLVKGALPLAMTVEVSRGVPVLSDPHPTQIEEAGFMSVSLDPQKAADHAGRSRRSFSLIHFTLRPGTPAVFVDPLNGTPRHDELELLLPPGAVLERLRRVPTGTSSATTEFRACFRHAAAPNWSV